MERLVDNNGTVVADLDHNVWGVIVDPAADVVTPLRAPGQWHDHETGLSYNRSRYYDPECGRFITPDAVGLLGGLNQFSAGTDPTLDVDPSGEWRTVERNNRTPDEIGQLHAEADDWLDDSPIDKGIRGAHKRGIKRDNMECNEVVQAMRKEMAKQGGLGKGSNTLIQAPHRASLQTQGGQEWYHHHVYEPDPPNGKVYDPDQQKVFNSRKDYVDAMFKNDSVYFTTDHSEPSLPYHYGKGQGYQ